METAALCTATASIIIPKSRLNDVGGCGALRVVVEVRKVRVQR